MSVQEEQRNGYSTSWTGLVPARIERFLEPDWPHQGILSESEVAQSCPTLCDPMDCSLPGFSVHGIFQARVLEGFPFPSPGDLPDSGIEPRFPTL